ncbi:hypothetical protein J4E81_001706 [Alternaria sp. BMP 2799]|nr:hypothetical protein J4E81_001706 [Alternaria sp. BMP 2799]
MLVEYDGDKFEYQPQNPDELDMSKPWGIAYKALSELNPPPLFLEQAKGNPRLALVNPNAKLDDERRRFFVVGCVVWNGTILPSCTTDFLAQWNCKHRFGWKVEDEDNAVYKYSKNIEQNPEKKPLFDWIKPPNISRLTTIRNTKGTTDDGPKMDSLILGAGSDLENTKGIADWKNREYQRIFWFSMIVRELLPEEHKKTGAIDTYKVLLPAESAKSLLGLVEKGQCGLMDELRDWLERSIKADQDESS